MATEALGAADALGGGLGRGVLRAGCALTGATGSAATAGSGSGGAVTGGAVTGTGVGSLCSTEPIGDRADPAADGADFAGVDGAALALGLSAHASDAPNAPNSNAPSTAQAARKAARCL
jgi:hypothetical protein